MTSRNNSSESAKESVTLSRLIMQKTATIRNNTRKGYLTLSHHIQQFHPQEIPVTNVTPELCQSFARYLLQQMKPNSARTYLQKLHTLLQQCVVKGIIAKHPMASISDILPKYTPPERCFLLKQELKRLQSAACPHESTRLAFLFACHTGLRLSDIETLLWEDVHECNGRYMVVKKQVKTQHEVRIPLDQYATAILMSIRQEPLSIKRPVFQLLSRTMIAQDLRKWSQAAGLQKKVTFHVSRHTFATLMASNQCDIFVVSQLCGHTNIRTTQIYARLIDEARFHAIDRLDSLFANTEPKSSLELRLR